MLGPSNLLHHPSLAQVHHVRAEKEALSSAKDGWIGSGRDVMSQVHLAK